MTTTSPSSNREGYQALCDSLPLVTLCHLELTQPRGISAAHAFLRQAPIVLLRDLVVLCRGSKLVFSPSRMVPPCLRIPPLPPPLPTTLHRLAHLDNQRRLHSLLGQQVLKPFDLRLQALNFHQVCRFGFLSKSRNSTVSLAGLRRWKQHSNLLQDFFTPALVVAEAEVGWIFPSEVRLLAPYWMIDAVFRRIDAVFRRSDGVGELAQRP